MTDLVKAEPSRRVLITGLSTYWGGRLAQALEGFEQIEAAAVDGKGRRVREHDPLCGELEAFMLAPHITAISLE